MQWFQRLLSRHRRYDDLAVSIQEHLEERTEELMDYGTSREEAARTARREFGSVTQITERSRQEWQWPTLESIWADVCFALYQLRKSPGFAITAILTLALGVGATTAIFSVVKAVLLAPLPYKDASRIVVVWTANSAGGHHPSTAGDFAIWKQRSGVFEDLAPSYDDEHTLTGQGAPQLLIGYAVSANYLRILGVQPQLGRLYTDQGADRASLCSANIYGAPPFTLIPRSWARPSHSTALLTTCSASCREPSTTQRLSKSGRPQPWLHQPSMISTILTCASWDG